MITLIMMVIWFHLHSITKTPIDFTNFYFTLDKDDSVYGIYKDNSLKMFEIHKE